MSMVLADPMERPRAAQRTPAIALLVWMSLSALPLLLRAPPGVVRTIAPPAVSDQSPRPPIDIHADRLETFKADQRAVYSGAVEAIQGRQRLRTPRLTVYSEPKATSSGGGAPKAMGGEPGRIKRMEAEGPVFFNDDTQNARGDHGLYLAADDTISLTGNVVLKQGVDVTTADKIVIDQATHHATLYSGASAPRIRSVVHPEGAATETPPGDLDHQRR
jgi:lipopolysaccharide export system protein LptA